MEALQLQKYDKWLAEHLDELITRYPGKVVAIYEGKVVIVSDLDRFRICFQESQGILTFE